MTIDSMSVHLKIMEFIKLFVTFASCLIGTIIFAQDVDVIMDSGTIVEDLLKEDGMTRGINVQAVSTPSSDKTKSVSKSDEKSPSVVALNIQFHFDSAKLTESAILQLNELGKAITSKQLNHYTFELMGHTDSVGNHEYNQWLSEQRALSTKHYLIKNFNVKKNKLITYGYGEEKPLLLNDPTNSINRRVEIRILTRTNN